MTATVTRSAPPRRQHMPNGHAYRCRLAGRRAEQAAQDARQTRCEALTMAEAVRVAQTRLADLMDAYVAALRDWALHRRGHDLRRAIACPVCARHGRTSKLRYEIQSGLRPAARLACDVPDCVHWAF